MDSKDSATFQPKLMYNKEGTKNMSARVKQVNRRTVKSRWHAVAYARLSRDDGGEGVSGSIENQLQIIKDFARRRGNVRIVATYADDGFSGTMFNRPGFTKMMQDAQTGLFDTIIVKDQSRFGRNYLEVGEWVERRLPAMGIRLYSIADDFDSTKPRDYSTALLFPIKNITNELYAWTTSEKTRASLETRRKQGRCVANFAPYGYMKDPTDKGRLVIDPEAGAIVRHIFEWRRDGLSLNQIATRLNQAGILTPLDFKRSRGSAQSCPFCSSEQAKWQPGQVARILENEVYTGTLVQGKRRRGAWGSHVTVSVPRELWDRAEGAHEPIVSKELFLSVQGPIRLRGQEEVAS